MQWLKEIVFVRTRFLHSTQTPSFSKKIWWCDAVCHKAALLHLKCFPMSRNPKGTALPQTVAKLKLPPDQSAVKNFIALWIPRHYLDKTNKQNQNT